MTTADAASVDEGSENRSYEAGIERLVFFSDAVYAIAITLLALDIRLPAGSAATASNHELTRSLLDLWPSYLSFVLSFIVIGNFWIAHHARVGLIVRYDTRFLLFNLLHLMAVAFIPFPTAVLSESGNRTATIFYALAITATGVFSAVMWWYATSGGRLVDGVTPERARRTLISILTVPAVFIASIALAFIDPTLAKVSWILTMPAALLAR